jgi:hypothetical protein
MVSHKRSRRAARAARAAAWPSEEACFGGKLASISGLGEQTGAFVLDKLAGAPAPSPGNSNAVKHGFEHDEAEFLE